MLADLVAGGNAGLDSIDHTDPRNWAALASRLQFIVEPGQVVELRAIGHQRGATVGVYDHEHLGSLFFRGMELSRSGGFKGVYITLNPLNKELLARAPIGVHPNHKAALDSDVLYRRWLLIDVDPRRPGTCSATEAEKARAEAKILEIRQYLGDLLWPEPILADSGNGYHLLYRLDLPANDGGLVRKVLHALADRFDDDEVEIDRKVFNPARITKLYGTRACKGQSSPERPHRWTKILHSPDRVQVVSRDLLEQLAPLAAGKPSTVPRTGHESVPALVPYPTTYPTDQKVKLARAYIAKIAPAVEGKGGDKQTFTVACYLMIDFDLTPEAAWPLMVEYNQRCKPPWEENDLRRKLELAAERPGERGRLLRSAGRQQPQSQQGSETGADKQEVKPGGPPFCLVVPDFIQWDYSCTQPRTQIPKHDKLGRPNKQPFMQDEWFEDILRWLVIIRRQMPVVVPSILLGQLIYGPRTPGNPWSRNWKRAVVAGIQSSWKGKPGKCTASCPLFGRTDAPHQHSGWNLGENDLGVMSQFIVERTENGKTTFNFENKLTAEEVAARKDELRQEIKERKAFLPRFGELYPSDYPKAKAELRAARVEYKRLRPGMRKVKGVRAIYLPVRFFGPSPRSGLAHSQCNMLSALTMELTRTNVNNGRSDKAQVVRGGKAKEHQRERFVPCCPFLEQGEQYILFNGTGKGKRTRLHGYGFKLVTWMKKAGYPDSAEYPIILADLHKLVEPFGLVVAGWNSKLLQWKTLEEMRSMTKSKAGREWLNNCVVRVYTRSDYLARWRRYFADRLGFSCIPGEDGNEANPKIPGEPYQGIRSGAELQVWMQKRGLSDRQLAAALGVHRCTVNLYKTGERGWSPRFQSKLEAYLQAGKM